MSSSESDIEMQSPHRGWSDNRIKCCHCTPQCTSIIGLKQRRHHYQKAPKGGIHASTTPPPSYFHRHRPAAIKDTNADDSESQHSSPQNQ